MSERPLTLQRPYQPKPGFTNLSRFVSDGDQNLPPIFVGREGILESVRKDVAICQENSEQETSYTRVI